MDRLKLGPGLSVIAVGRKPIGSATPARAAAQREQAEPSTVG
jgi:hypothetical protein